MFAEIAQPKKILIVCYTQAECEKIFKELSPIPRPLYKLWERNKRVLYNEDTYYLKEFYGLMQCIKGTSLDKIYISNSLTDTDKKYIIDMLYPILREQSKDNVIYK